MCLLERLNISCDNDRPDRGPRRAAIFAPDEELGAGRCVSSARVRVADIRGEEFDVAPGGFFAFGADELRDKMAAVGQGVSAPGLRGRGR